MSHLNAEQAKTFDVQQFYQNLALKPDKMGSNSGIAVYLDGSMKIGNEKGCHGYMSEFVRGGYFDYSKYPPYKTDNVLTAIYTSLWSHTYDDSDLEYFRFILNEKYSPWKEHIKGREIIWGEKDGKKIPIAVKLVDMNASTQVVFNFLLASRIIYAQPSLARSYKAFRKEGFTRTESVFLSANVGINTKDTFVWPYLGDFPYDTAFTNMDWKKWSEGKPRFDKTKKLCNSADYSPCNAIWNRGTNSSGIVIANHLKNTAIQNLVSEEKEIKNVFGKTEKKRVPLSIDDAVIKLNDNQEEWKCLNSTSLVEEQDEKIPQPLTNSSYYMATPLYANPLGISTVSFFPEVVEGLPLSFTVNSPSVSWPDSTSSPIS